MPDIQINDYGDKRVTTIPLSASVPNIMVNEDTLDNLDVIANPQKVNPLKNVNITPLEENNLPEIEKPTEIEPLDEPISTRDEVPLIQSTQSTQPIQSVEPTPSFFSSFDIPNPSSHRVDEEIRCRKAYLLQRYAKRNARNQYSPRYLSMDDSLETIENELATIHAQKSMEQSLDFCRDLLSTSCRGLAFIYNRFDPFDVDMLPWAKETAYNTSQGAYDEILEELAEKYSDSVSVGPELKLLMILGTSFGKHLIHQKSQQILQDKKNELRMEMLRREMTDKMNRGFENLQNEFKTQPTQKVDLAGPSQSPQDIKDLLGNEFIDTTIGGIDEEDDIKLGNDEATEEIKVSEPEKPTIPKKRGRKRRQDKEEQELKTVSVVL